MKIATAGTPADTAILREQLTAAHNALVSAVVSLERAGWAAEDSGKPQLKQPIIRLESALEVTLGWLRKASGWLYELEGMDDQSD